MCLLWLRHTRQASLHLRYFVWLLAAYNLFTGCGYVVSSSVRDAGDLVQAFRGVAWRLILPSYFAAAAVACAPAARNPILPSTALMVVSTTPGAWGFLFLPLAWCFGRPVGVSERLTKHPGWVLAGAIPVALFVGAPGPGIRLDAATPPVSRATRK